MNEKHITTIQYFGGSLLFCTKNDCCYSLSDYLQNFFVDMLYLSKVENTRVVDIGSGAGRIVNMLLDAGGFFILALEQFFAFDACKRTVKNRDDSVELLIKISDFSAFNQDKFSRDSEEYC